MKQGICLAKMEINSFPPAFQQGVENWVKKFSRKIHCFADGLTKFPLFQENPIPQAVQSGNSRFGFSTEFSRNFPFPLHNFCTIPRRKIWLLSFSLFHFFSKVVMWKKKMGKTPQIRRNGRVSTFQPPLLLLLFLFMNDRNDFQHFPFSTATRSVESTVQI